MFRQEILLTLVNAVIALVMLTLSVIMLRISRKKFFFAILLSAIYLAVDGYYAYLTFFVERPSIMETQVIKHQPPSNPEQGAEEMAGEKGIAPEPDFQVIILTGSNTFMVAPEDELEVKKNIKFQIKGVVCPSGNKENIRADLKGFVGNARFNDNQDIGYQITYDRIMKRWAIEGERDKYEIVVKDGDRKLGSVYVRFID